MKAHTVIVYALLSASLASCMSLDELVPTYPDYGAQANAIADWILMQTITKEAECRAAGGCVPTYNVNVRQ